MHMHQKNLDTHQFVTAILTHIAPATISCKHTCDLQDPSSRRFADKAVYIWNVVVGGICLLLLSFNLAIFAGRVLQASSLGKHW